MKKLARSQMILWKRKHLNEVQHGLCPLCHLPIDLSIKAEGVIDHDHISGRIRGVLHRSCNAAEGKVSNAAARWGAKSSDPVAVHAWLKNLLEYWDTPKLELIYPMHLTEEEKNDKRLVRQKELRALRKAKVAMAKQRKLDGTS